MAVGECCDYDSQCRSGACSADNKCLEAPSDDTDSSPTTGGAQSNEGADNQGTGEESSEEGGEDIGSEKSGTSIWMVLLVVVAACLALGVGVAVGLALCWNKLQRPRSSVLGAGQPVHAEAVGMPEVQQPVPAASQLNRDHSEASVAHVQVLPPQPPAGPPPAEGVQGEPPQA